MKTDDALPTGAVTERGEAARDADAANGVANGVANGSASGSGAFTSRDDLPDVRDTVVAAAAVAGQRAMPLRPAAMTAAPASATPNMAAPQQMTSAAPVIPPSSSAKTVNAADIKAADINAAATASGAQTAAPRGTMPQAAPWNQLPPGALENVRPVDIMRSLRAIEPQMKAVEKEIERLITTPVKLIADLASHTMGAGGKRLRPALTILCAQLCGDDATRANSRVITCAASVELMHTTALIHDDVVDGAATRRGKPAANLVWGNETSVLVGDYLFAQVFVTVAQQGFVDLMPPIAQATAQLCAGELLETQTRGLLSMKEKQYCDIIALKTAALTECACRLGAMAVGAPDEHIERLARYGRDIGMAFQIVDDVFDVIATETRVGKPVGNDIREGDITLPMLRAMQVCSDSEKDELRALVGKDPINDGEVARALEILRGCDAVPYAMRVAGEYIASAKAQLQFADGPAREGLYDIADYVLSREK